MNTPTSTKRIHKTLGTEYVGIYELFCKRCKHHLTRQSGEAWWWQPQTQYGTGVFRYRTHDDDDCMLDMRHMWCSCREGDLTAVNSWEMTKLPIIERTWKLTIHTNNGDDPTYYRDQLLRLAHEMGFALTLTIE